jgi:hypothetical protein
MAKNLGTKERDLGRILTAHPRPLIRPHFCGPELDLGPISRPKTWPGILINLGILEL